VHTLGLGPAALVLLPVLLVGAAALARLARLGHERAIPIAGLRALLQLTAVGLVVGFALRSYAATLGFLVLMLGVATVTCGGRLRGSEGLPYAYGFAGLAIGLPSVTVLGLLVGTGSVPANPETILPLGGILIGGAMTATSLAGRRLLAELRDRRGQYEAALALGFGSRQAVLLVVGSAAGDALVPALDQTRTVGLVTLPGAFVGMVLGGASPLRAAALQLVVLVCLLAVEACSIWLITELVAVRWRPQTL
jgi:putative ABC transport system permease protein